MMQKKRRLGMDARPKKYGWKRFKNWTKTQEARCFLVMLIGAACMLAIFCAAITPERYDLQVGSIANKTIMASKDVVDEVTTAARREAAANQVEPSYHLKEGASEAVMSDLAIIFQQLINVKDYGQNLLAHEEKSSRVFNQKELEYARSLLTDLTLADYQMQTLLNTSDADFINMQESVTAAVRNSLNTTIREGQVNQSIQTIQQLVGYRVETDLLQNVVTPILRKCIQPNMVIEQEATALAQEKARAEVEPVVYVQGQNIIRAGERVSANQLAMLRSLGLLDDNSVDVTMYVGAVLVILCTLTAMLVFLKLLRDSIWHQVKQTVVLMLVLTLTLALCCGTMMVGNSYLVPLAMGAMLLTGLMGSRVALAGNFALSIIVSALSAGGSNTYSTEMVHLLLTGLLSGTFAVYFLKEKPQRIRVLICGLGVSVINLLVMLAIGLMTNNDLGMVLSNSAWSMGGGLAAAVISLGMQPLFETAFNLATPSKLLEWTNPNQPLSRKLLLEASGTYHHSLIVANLAEAAAEAIGANPLLVRAGAYYHDVGKLKRPMYFKENQKGDNPQDHTDPYVSAAIVTAHTRDGLQLAKKYRLPVEIQDIIMEHHGDTPVMFFYHKALQQPDGKAVDVKDFRYDGRRPRTKESAIIMLADTVEAAVRSLPDPTPKNIEAAIERLIRGKLEDGQLSESPLTLKDIDKICAAFAQSLNGAFHERIEYPNVAIPSPGQQSLTPPVPEKLVASEVKTEAREEDHKTAKEEMPVQEEESAGQVEKPQIDAEKEPEDVQPPQEDETHED
ncbi:MAG: HDIG domain-containing protein [Clostridia bacterium]|nr:HDIG domain-containing protein [Clostridia bacterium]